MHLFLFLALLSGSPLLRGGEHLKTPGLVQLLVEPQKFEGQRVLLTGVLVLEGGTNRLCLTREHAHLALGDYCLDLEIHQRASPKGAAQFGEEAVSVSQANLEYVEILGMFVAKPASRGHRLERIEKVRLLEAEGPLQQEWNSQKPDLNLDHASDPGRLARTSKRANGHRLLEILVAPEAFDRKRVRLTGTLMIESGANRLCVSREHAELILPDFCIGLSLGKSEEWHGDLEAFLAEMDGLAESNLEYVEIEGRFSTEGPVGLSGHLEDVATIMFLEVRDGRHKPTWRGPHLRPQ